jgi:hypothetical protein
MLNWMSADMATEGSEMTIVSDRRGAGRKDFPDIRREPRTVAAIVVEVSGFDVAGCFFTEHTSTANLSDNGCCFRVNTGVSPGAFVALQSNGHADLSYRPVFYQVVWMQPLSSGLLVGASRLLGESASRGVLSASISTHVR